ncbi:MAG TPA: hypothetical protein VLQ46_00530 [Casimicrobiaceae bacterium]|nr:hypothetical protein [Casimicrobiaceae bacterium]
MTHAKRLGRNWLALAAIAVVAGCVSQETKRDAINDINEAFKVEYEAALAKDGSHVVNAGPGDAYDAVYASFVKLGLVVRQGSRGLGFISAEGPAPLPLDRSEWDRAAANDLPKTKELLRRHIGALAEFFHFEPEGLDTVMTATIIGARDGAEISFTMRMREVVPAKSDLPRRDYPPPTALRIGLEKLWSAVDRELATLPRKP